MKLASTEERERSCERTTRQYFQVRQPARCPAASTSGRVAFTAATAPPRSTSVNTPFVNLDYEHSTLSTVLNLNGGYILQTLDQLA